MDNSDPMSTNSNFMVQTSLANGSNTRRGSEGASSSSGNTRPSTAQPQLRQQLTNRPGSAPEQNKQTTQQQQEPLTKASLYQSANGIRGGVISNVYSRKAARSVSLTTSTSTSLQPHPPSSIGFNRNSSDSATKRPMSANTNGTQTKEGGGAISRLLERFSQSRGSGGGGGGSASTSFEIQRSSSSNGATCLLTAEPKSLDQQVKVGSLDQQVKVGRALVRSNSTPSAGLTPTTHSSSPLAAVHTHGTSVLSLDRSSGPLIADRSGFEMKATPVITMGKSSSHAHSFAPPSQPQGRPLFVRRTHITPSASIATAAPQSPEPAIPRPSAFDEDTQLVESPTSPTPRLPQHSSLGLRAISISSRPHITPTNLFSPPSSSTSGPPNGLSSPKSPSFRGLVISIPGEANEHAALKQIPLFPELPMTSVTPLSHHKQKHSAAPAYSQQPSSCDGMSELMDCVEGFAAEVGLSQEWLVDLISQIQYKMLLKSIEARRHST